MPSITAWTRLEPQTQQTDLNIALQARLYDPLWMLSRQWQTGEFGGEDAGSPVSVRMRGAHYPLVRYRAGPLPSSPDSPQGGSEAYGASRLPLETLVEREAIRIPGGSYDRRLAAEAGLYFLSLLTRQAPPGLAQLRHDYLATYPLQQQPAPEFATLDTGSQRSLTLLSGRAPDGFRLYADLRAVLAPTGGATPALPARPTVAAADVRAVTAAALEYVVWYEDLYREPAGANPSWQPERMEYAFALSAPTPDGELTLAAREYAQSDIDWYTFDVVEDTLGVDASDPTSEEFVKTVLPSPASFPGMPADRWWEFEDAKVNFGRMEAAPDDLLRMAFTGFSLNYSNDWFIAPLTARPGGLYRIHSLVVTDSFGDRTLVPHYATVDGPDAGWRLYALDSSRSRAADSGNLLFLPPVLPTSLRSEPVEEVVLARDEMANQAWAVEKKVAGPAGLSLDRYEIYRRVGAAQQSAGAVAGVSNGEWLYRLATTVPDYWFPLLPVRIVPDHPAIRLVLGRMLAQEAGEQAPQPAGRLLAVEGLSLFEEEVPRSAVQVTRAWRYTRAADGTTCVWIGRHKGSGRGPAFSGLRYDVINTT